jgi:aminopeptidase N
MFISFRIPVNLRHSIYCTAVANGDESVWDFAWTQYLGANVASEKDIILRALTCSKNESILSRYLNWSITEGSGVRKQDSRSVIQNVALNKIGNPLVFKFLQTEWTRIKS